MIFCENCGHLINDNEIQYEIKIEMFAKVGPLSFTDKDLKGDNIQEMNKIIDSMNGMTEEEADEAADEVWECYNFTLCRKCRKDFHSKFKLKKKGGQ